MAGNNLKLILDLKHYLAVLKLDVLIYVLNRSGLFLHIESRLAYVV